MRFADVDLNENADDGVGEDVSMSGASDDDDEQEEEEEEEEEEGDPSEFIDVLDVLDGRGEPDSGDDMGNVEKQEHLSDEGKNTSSAEMVDDEEDEVQDGDGSDESGSEEDIAEEEGNGNHIVSASEDEDEVGDSALQELDTFVSGLDAGQKRKAPDEDDARDVEAQRARRRRLLPERTETGVENEFAATSGTCTLHMVPRYSLRNARRWWQA